MKLLNSFSLNMCVLPCAVAFKVVEQPTKEVLASMESCIGHPDTAALVGVVANRATVKLELGEEFMVAQYIGPRLPEGTTTLPEGARIEFICGRVLSIPRSADLAYLTCNY
jgi:hypothetical protein